MLKRRLASECLATKHAGANLHSAAARLGVGVRFRPIAAGYRILLRGPDTGNTPETQRKHTGNTAEAHRKRTGMSPDSSDQLTSYAEEGEISEHNLSYVTVFTGKERKWKKQYLTEWSHHNKQFY